MTIKTEGVQGLPQPGLDAAREGRAYCCWANAQAALNAAATVITAADSYINMIAGRRYIVRCIYYNLSTASDTIQYELVTTALPAGGGAVTARTPYFNAATAATIEGSPMGPIPLDPPVVLTLADGACIAMRVLTNDAGATVNVGFTGWWEADD